MLNIFISYSTKDIDYVNNVQYSLEGLGNGIKIFRADQSVEPGEYLTDKISTAITNCNLFLLFWSENAKKSEWVPLEVGKAHSLKKELLPLLLTQHLELPPFLYGMKYIPLYKNSINGLNQIEKLVRYKLSDNELARDALTIGGTIVALSVAAFCRLKKNIDKKDANTAAKGKKSDNYS